MAALLYYITDRAALGPDEPGRRARLLEKVAEAAAAGVDYIQLRERDLETRELEKLAEEARARVEGSGARLLINSRLDVALGVGAHGVHLRADDISPRDARRACELARQPEMLIAVSCHSRDAVAQAAREAADLAVFAPVFQKDERPGVGVNRLREAADAAAGMPLLALGGVTLRNAGQCLAVGAAGIAAIRLFQENAIAEVVAELRLLSG
jgi:thiamine-phosphate pyrophosphorylase